MKDLLGAAKTTALVVSAFLNGALVMAVALETGIIYMNYKEKGEKVNVKKSETKSGDPIITLYSTINPEMEIVLIAHFRDEPRLSYLRTAAKAYKDAWMLGTDDINDMPIGDYISTNLEGDGFIRGLHYDMYFGADWDTGKDK